MPPRFESVLAEPGGLGTASLRCTVSDGRIESCGFLYGVGERLDNRLECELSGLAFEAKLTGLSDGTAYSFCAYASAGGAEIKSETYTFRSVSRNEPVPIEDPAFKTWLVQQGYDTDSDGEISYEEARRVTSINITPTNKYNLQSLKGIEYMPNLEYINCIGEWYETPGKSTPPDREYYYIGLYRNNWDWWGPIGTLRYVNVSGNPKLKSLYLGCNSALGEELGTIDLTHNPSLESINLDYTLLEYPDISGNVLLKQVYLSHLHGSFPDLSSLDLIEYLSIDHPQDAYLFGGAVTRIDLDVSNMADLKLLHASSRIRSISDLSSNPKLSELTIAYNGLTALDVSSNTMLEYLACEDNQIAFLDLSHNPILKQLRCWRNNLKTLDVSGNLHLSSLWCAPMNDNSGNNLLETLYIALGQSIPLVTENRSTEHIPPDTIIKIVNN